jgi:hypothetical protein
MSASQKIASSPFIAVALISVVATPLARTEFVPVWYGCAMVFTGQGYSLLESLSAVGWSYFPKSLYSDFKSENPDPLPPPRAMSLS